MRSELAATQPWQTRPSLCDRDHAAADWALFDHLDNENVRPRLEYDPNFSTIVATFLRGTHSRLFDCDHATAGVNRTMKPPIWEPPSRWMRPDNCAGVSA